MIEDDPIQQQHHASLNINDDHNDTTTTIDNNNNNNNNNDIPIDRSEYQRPKEALTSRRFIINLILGCIVGWGINSLIAAVSTINSSRTSLWHSFDDFIDPLTDKFIRMYKFPVFIDAFLSCFITAFVGTFIAHFTLRYEVSRAKKRPIHPTYMTHIIFSILGVYSKRLITRAFIYSTWATVVCYPALMILFAIGCNVGTFDTMQNPPSFTHSSCYLSRFWFCLIKGLFCAIVTTLLGPLLEVGELNYKNLSTKTISRYQNIKHKNQQEPHELTTNNEIYQQTNDETTTIAMSELPPS